jgi:SAM-dependent methyltransferase
MLLQSLSLRLNDSFVSGEVTIANSQGKRKLTVHPVWDTDRFRVQVQGKSPQEGAADEIIGEIISVIGEKDDFLLVFVDRTSELTMERRRGKVSTRISDKKRLDADQDHVSYEPAGGTRQQFVNVREAADLFRAVGIMSEDGQVKGDKRRKLYQVDRFIELVAQMLDNWPEGRELTILDCGCGKSYLSFALNYYIHEKLRKPCYFIGIDNNEKVVAASRAIQEKLMYRNMEFVVSDVKDYKPGRKVDMVLSLHACDTATDMALALGVDLGSKYIVAVPCCQSSLNDEIDFGSLAPIAAYNVFKTRLADTITDGLRSLGLEAYGYRVSVAEYVSPLDTPKNIMLRAEYTGKTNAVRTYAELKEKLGIVPWLDRLLEARRSD